MGGLLRDIDDTFVDNQPDTFLSKQGFELVFQVLRAVLLEICDGLLHPLHLLSALQVHHRHDRDGIDVIPGALSFQDRADGVLCDDSVAQLRAAEQCSVQIVSEQCLQPKEIDFLWVHELEVNLRMKRRGSNVLEYIVDMLGCTCEYWVRAHHYLLVAVVA